MSGYPEMIDPATGLVWGIDPDTGEMYDGLLWPLDDDDEPMDPMWTADKSIFGENPATPGSFYGIDAAHGHSYHSNILDNEGTIFNPVEDLPDCEEGYYRSLSLVCTEIPECTATNGEYAPPDAEVNEYGFVDCVAIPECDPGYERLEGEEPEEATGLIPCTELPACEEA